MDEIRVDENGLMLRPRRYDAIVRRRAAEMALPQVKRWIGPSSQSDASLIKELMKHIGGPNGFEICKSLDRDGWCCGDKMVEIMGEDFISDAEKELVRQWVRCLRVKLDLPIGTVVEYRGEGASLPATMRSWRNTRSRYRARPRERSISSLIVEIIG